MKELILDVSKWRCGGSGSKLIVGPDEGIGVGAGPTRMENREGYMCCLGQFTKQLRPDFDLLCKLSPFSMPEDYEFCADGENNLLASEAIDINDNWRTTVDDKIEKLKDLFLAHGYTIKVINYDKSQFARD